MSDFLTIDQARKKFTAGESKNISFIATVIKQGELKSGTKGDKDWTNKRFTLQDSSGEIEITLWDYDVSLLKIGYKYEFLKPYWSDYQGNPQVTNNNYGKITVIGTATNQTVIDETPEESSTPQADVHNEPTDDLEKFTLVENTIISKIFKIVRAEIQKETDGSEQVRGDVVWVRTKEIYNLWRRK